MTITVSLSNGIQYCIGQSLYYSGQWYRIADKFQIMDERGKVTGYNVILERR